MPNNRVNLSTQKDCDGVFQLGLNNVSTMTAKLGRYQWNLKCGVFKITKGYWEQPLGKVSAKWFSNFFIWEKGASNSNKQYEFETAIRRYS